MCRSCWEKFNAALTVAGDLVPHLRSVERGPKSVDGIRTTTVSQPSFPVSWQKADHLWRMLAGVLVGHAQDTGADVPAFPYWTGLEIGFSISATIDMVTRAVRDVVRDIETGAENIVARSSGAEAAIRFYREVQNVLASFPLEEQERKMPHLRCRNCKQLTMVDKPPLEYQEPRVIQCTNPGCGNVYDPQMLDWDLKLYRVELEEAMQVASDVALAAVIAAGHEVILDPYDLTATCTICGVPVMQRVVTRWYPNTTLCGAEAKEVAA